MKAKLLTTLCALGIAALFCACETTIGDASLVEGAWELKTEQRDKTVYADLSGNSHLKDSATTRTYDNKDMVWLFYQNSISWWSYFEYEGEGFWDGYNCDCYRNYTIEGEGDNMVIVETGGSIIPGMEDHQTVTRYKVEKLTKNQMVLSCTDKMYISDTQSSVDVHVIYTFKRENTLLDFIHSVYPDN